MPKRLIIGKPICQHSSYSRGTLHSNMSKEQHEKIFRISTIHPDNSYEIKERFTHKMCECHNSSISAMTNSFHNIKNKNSVRITSEVFMP